MEGIHTALRGRRARPRRGLVDRALGRAEAFLESRQEPEGRWRDIDEPAKGPGDATVTAFAGWCLARARGTGRPVLGRAAGWLLAARRPDGTWGFNEDCLSDADTTAWSLRFLARLGRPASPAELRALEGFRRPGGGYSACREAEMPNDWGRRVHPDVSAAVLSCLVESGVAGAREAALEAARASWSPAGWPSPWWGGSRLFGTWVQAELLAEAGGLSLLGRTALPDARTPLDLALRLRCLELLGLDAGAERGALLERQLPSGGWEGSPLMTLPPQGGEPGRGPFPDGRGIFTTAAAVLALAGGGA